MTEPQCKHCTHFHQHYVLISRGFATADCGHCSFPRLKNRSPGTLACVYFQPIHPEEWTLPMQSSE